MIIFYTDTFTIPIPANHSFPKDKYYLLRKRIIETQLVQPGDMRVPQPAVDEDILRAHDPIYLNRLQKGKLTAKEVRRVGLPWSPEMVLRARYSVGATIEKGMKESLDACDANLVIYLAGADPYRNDRFGRLSLTKDGLAGRDQIVLRHLFQSGLPVAITMAGGYARQARDSVDIHFQTVSTAAKFHQC